MREKIEEVLAAHAHKAAASEYDRAVCISAVAATRRIIFEQFEASGRLVDADALINHLQQFHANYNDPDGVYTSGKGVIGDLIADLGPVIRSHDG